jgi:hypothetical protein
MERQEAEMAILDWLLKYVRFSIAGNGIAIHTFFAWCLVELPNTLWH